MTEEHITRDAVLAALANHVGADRGISAIGLAAEILEDMPSPEAAARTVRHRVEELRGLGHHVCAHPSTGYFIAETEAELLATCEYLHSRAMTSLRQIAAMQRVSVPDLRGQLRLPS